MNENPSLSGLLNYSDDEESSDDEETKATTSKTTNQQQSSPPTPTRKKRRRISWDNASTDDVLPPPPTSFNKSLIQWDADYTASYRTPPKSVNTNPQLIQKLETLGGQADDNHSERVSWAQHLKSQHEFHNPHFFDNVVTHFGIQHPLQSNVQEDELNFQLYEYDLVAAEEQARIRQEQRQHQEQSSVISQYAQAQFDRAMGRARGMSM